MTEIGVMDARNNLSHLIKQALLGEEIVITAHGRPQVRLDPIEAKPPAGSADAILALLRTFPPSRYSADEIEASIQQERNSWE